MGVGFLECGPSQILGIPWGSRLGPGSREVSSTDLHTQKNVYIYFANIKAGTNNAVLLSLGFEGGL